MSLLQLNDRGLGVNINARQSLAGIVGFIKGDLKLRVCRLRLLVFVPGRYAGKGREVECLNVIGAAGVLRSFQVRNDLAHLFFFMGCCL